jgi:hypothetical protein
MNKVYGNYTYSFTLCLIRMAVRCRAATKRAVPEQSAGLYAVDGADVAVLPDSSEVALPPHHHRAADGCLWESRNE